MQARDRWLAKNPSLTAIGAHLGSMAYDVAEVARRLELYPNFYVETAARFADLAKQRSSAVRDTLLHQLNPDHAFESRWGALVEQPESTLTRVENLAFTDSI